MGVTPSLVFRPKGSYLALLFRPEGDNAEQKIAYEIPDFLHFTPSVPFPLDYTKLRSFGLTFLLRAKIAHFALVTIDFLLGKIRNPGPKYCYTATLGNPKSIVIVAPRY